MNWPAAMPESQEAHNRLFSLFRKCAAGTLTKPEADEMETLESAYVRYMSAHEGVTKLMCRILRQKRAS